MWRRLLIILLCCASVFSYNIHFNGKETDSNSDLVFDEPLRSNSGEEDVDLESIYYRTNLKSDIIVPYDDEDDFQRKHDFSREDTSDEEDDPTFQPWSILWYIGSFGGLIAFFLVVSCSEWCCRNRRRRESQNSTSPSPTPTEAPPPAYDLFAPPSYESLHNNGEKRDFDVFVVPVHAMENLTENPVRQRDEPSAPPAYFETSANLRRENIPNHDEVVLNVARVEEEHREGHKVQREVST